MEAMSKITEQELESLADAFYKSQTGYERQNSTFEEAWLRLARKCVEKAGIKIKDEPGKYPKPTSGNSKK